jgi:hypothetical protein
MMVVKSLGKESKKTMDYSYIYGIISHPFSMVMSPLFAPLPSFLGDQ